MEGEALVLWMEAFLEVLEAQAVVLKASWVARLPCLRSFAPNPLFQLVVVEALEGELV